MQVWSADTVPWFPQNFEWEWVFSDQVEVEPEDSFPMLGLNFAARVKMPGPVDIWSPWSNVVTWD